MTTFDHRHDSATGRLGHSVLGRGPHRVLVLHDWFGTHRNWDRIRPFLDGARRTWVFADLRGHGLSFEATGTHDLDEMAGDCRRLVDGLGWERFSVVGHSMTGMVVERLILDLGERIAAAVAVAALSAAGNRMDPAARRVFEATTHDDEALRRVLRFVAGGLGAEAIDAKLRRNRSEVAAPCRSAELRMFTETDFADRAGDDRTPFLVVAGSEDPGMDETALGRAFLPRYGRGETAVVSGSGHYPMEQQPERVAGIIEAFFDRHGV